MLRKDILLIINPNASKGRGRKKAKEIAKEVNVPDSSLKRYRTYWVTEGLLIKEKHGSYRKTDKGISAS